MKTKIEKNHSAKYAPIVLWWDDLTEIVETLKTNASAVELETSEYKFTTLDVAKDHFGEASQFDVKISASSPYCVIEGERLFVGAGPTSARIFLELDEILSKRQRRPRWFYSSWLIVPIVLAGGIYFLPLPDIIKNGDHRSPGGSDGYLFAFNVYSGPSRPRSAHKEKIRGERLRSA